MSIHRRCLKKKKSSFTLLEVLVAIALATFCFFFLISTEKAQIEKQREALQLVTIEEKLQEAAVKLYEALYLNKIDWKTVESGKGYVLELDNRDWKAEYSFTVAAAHPPTGPSVMQAAATIALLYKDAELKHSKPRVSFCVLRNASK